MKSNLLSSSAECYATKIADSLTISRKNVTDVAQFIIRLYGRYFHNRSYNFENIAQHTHDGQPAAEVIQKVADIQRLCFFNVFLILLLIYSRMSKEKKTLTFKCIWPKYEQL